MKAIVQDTYGPPSVLRLDELARPVPGNGEVLVRVHAAGVDAGVWHLMTGRPYLLRAAFGLRGPRLRVRGLDLAGQVEAVGPNVTGFRPGDEVYGTADGSFAEYVCVKTERIAPKPANLGFEQAAVVPVSACTALQGLRDAGRIQAGQTVLVIGAGGGVGTYAVQLAKSFGAHVTGVCSTVKTDRVRSIGADEVVDYTREDFADGPRRYDLILDIAGNSTLTRLRRVLTPRGTLVIAGGEGGGAWTGGIDRQLRAVLLSPYVGHRLTMLAAKPNQRDLRLLADLIESGSVTPVIDRTFPLADVPEAIHYLRQGRAFGKIAVSVQGS